MEQERTELGRNLTERLERRLARRPRIGFSPGFYERFGFSDPWLPQAYTDIRHDGDEYTYLSGAPFREFMERLGRRRWEREQRYQRRYEENSGVSSLGVASRQVRSPGRLGLFGSLSMVLPPPVVTAALAPAEDSSVPILSDARPFSHAKVSDSPWFTGPDLDRRASISKKSAPKEKPAVERPRSEPQELTDDKSIANKANVSRVKSNTALSPKRGKFSKSDQEEPLAIDLVRENSRTTLLAHKAVAMKTAPASTEVSRSAKVSRSLPKAANTLGSTENNQSITPESVSSGEKRSSFAPVKRTAPSHTQIAARRAEHVSFENSPIVNTLRDISPALPTRVRSALAAVLTDPTMNDERSDELVRTIIRKGGVPRAIRAMLEERLPPSDSQPMEAAVSRAAPNSTKRLQPVLSRSPVVGELLNPAASFLPDPFNIDNQAAAISDEDGTPRVQRRSRSSVRPKRTRTSSVTMSPLTSESESESASVAVQSLIKSPGSAPIEPTHETGSHTLRTSVPQSSWVAARSAYGTAPMGRSVRTLAPKIVSPVREEASVRVPQSRANRVMASEGTLLTPSVGVFDETESVIQGFSQSEIRPETPSVRGSKLGVGRGLSRKLGSSESDELQQSIDLPDATQSLRVSPQAKIEKRVVDTPTSDGSLAASKRIVETRPLERSSRLSMETPNQKIIDNNSPSSTVWAAERGDLPASSPVYSATSALRSHIPFAVSRAMKNAPMSQRYISVSVGKDELAKSSLVRVDGNLRERRSWDRSPIAARSKVEGVVRTESPSGRPVRWPAGSVSSQGAGLKYSHVEQSPTYASTTTPQGESWYEAPVRRDRGDTERGEITRVQRSNASQSQRYVGSTRFLGEVSGGGLLSSRRQEQPREIAPISGSRRWRGQRVSPTSIVARSYTDNQRDQPLSPMNFEYPALSDTPEFASEGMEQTYDRAPVLGERSSLRSRASQPNLRPQAPSLMRTLGDVARGDQSHSVPPWAERAVGGPPIRGAGDLIQSLARASSSEDVIRIIMDRGEKVSNAAELPSSTLEVVRQIQSEAKSELPRQRNLERRSSTQSQQPAMSGLVTPGGGRNYRPARRVSGWSGKPRQSVHGASGVGDDRIMKLAKRLKGLVLLAENNRRDEARKQVRLAANEAPKGAASAPGQGGDATAGQLEALVQEVVQAVGRELEMRRERTQEESDGWW